MTSRAQVYVTNNNQLLNDGAVVAGLLDG